MTRNAEWLTEVENHVVRFREITQAIRERLWDIEEFGTREEAKKATRILATAKVDQR